MMMAGRGGEDPYADWVKIRTRNYGTNRNCFRCAASYVSRMLVDGVEVTPVGTYDFGDSDYHDVFLLFNDITSLPKTALYLDNYTATHKDIPACVASVSEEALRNSGASEGCYVAIRAASMPTFDRYNFLGWTRGNLYVPSNLIADYKTLTGLADSKIHPLEDYPYQWPKY